MKPLVKPPKFPGAVFPFTPEPGYPDWPALIGASRSAWESAVASASGPVVVLGSHTGMHGAVVTLDSVLAVALTLRGAQVKLVLCDGILQGCLMTTYSDLMRPEVVANREVIG